MGEAVQEQVRAMTDQYDVGDIVTLYSVFTDADGMQTVPTTVELRVRKPDSTYATVVVEACEVGDLPRASVALSAFLEEHGLSDPLTDTDGVYMADVDLDQPGTWHYAWDFEGDLQAMEQSALYVRHDLVGMP